MTLELNVMLDGHIQPLNPKKRWIIYPEYQPKILWDILLGL